MWEVLTANDVLSEFTPNEAATLRNLQGSGSGSGPPFTNIDTIVARTIDEVRDYIRAGGYPVHLTNNLEDDTIPNGFFNDAIAIARWRILISVPQLKQLQTAERSKAFDDAIKKMLLIADQQFAVEPPVPESSTKTGNWNAENKLIMRTHPIPVPSTQFSPQKDTYANPDAPADRAPTP